MRTIIRKSYGIISYTRTIYIVTGPIMRSVVMRVIGKSGDLTHDLQQITL
jgi:hypothetical protein